MSKKTIIVAISILTLAILVGGAVFLRWKNSQKVVEQKRIQAVQQPIDEQQKQNKLNDYEDKNAGIESEKSMNMSWKIFRNEKYGFEVKYPSNWEVKILNTEFDNNGDDLFFFAKDEKNSFAVFPRGGFGHGIQEPKKITHGNFGGKKAKMFWYKYPFPLYINIVDNLPKNWGSENVIDIKISDDDQSLINDLNDIYRSFRFIE